MTLANASHFLGTFWQIMDNSPNASQTKLLILNNIGRRGGIRTPNQTVMSGLL